MAEKDAIKVPPTEQAKVKRWLELRAILAEAEAEKEAIQPHLEKALAKAPEHRKEYGPVSLTLVEVSTRRLDEKAAIEKLGPKTLAPFFKLGSYSKITVKGA